MNTILPAAINSEDEAKVFLLELIRNDEVYHPEDDANDIMWSCVPPTSSQCEQLNKLMNDISLLVDFDPCEFIVDNCPNDNHF